MSRPTMTWAVTGVGAVAIAAGVLALATRPPVAPAIPARVVNSVTSFVSGHPEWAPLRDGRRDTTPLRMGHALHMDPQLPGGPLTCVSCHVPDEQGLYMRPVQFSTHCAECHDANLGRINVAEGLVTSVATPHGSVVQVLAAIDGRIDAMVAAHPDKFVITASPVSEEAEPAEQPSSSRRRGRTPQSKTVDVPAFASAEDRDQWIQSLRTAAREKARNSCEYCHVAPDSASADGQWTITPPAIPDRWLPRSHYSHAAHAMLSCDQCHAARTSAETFDVLLPGIDSCRECHRPHSDGTGGAPTACVLCHSYHAPAPLYEGELRSVSLGASVITDQTPVAPAP